MLNNTSSSCSTLSDEDSTPHVSRSNSYGRSEDPDGSYDIYLREDHLQVRLTTPNTTSFGNSNCDTPPGYEETISRQRLLKHYNRSNSFVIAPVSSSSPSGSNGVRTRLVFEDSPRRSSMTNESNTSVSVLPPPPPLPPKTERPPLPPKQRIRLTIDDTYANSEELNRQNQESESELVYPNYTSARIHVSHEVSLTNSNPPQLPPKETQKKSVTRIGDAATQTRTMRNAETQTDETDFYLMYPEDEDDEYENEEEGDEDEEDVKHMQKEEDFCESNRSLSPDYYPSFHRTTLMDSLQINSPSQMITHRNPTTPTNAIFTKRPSSTTSTTRQVEMRQAGRRKLEPVQSVPVMPKKISNSSDPIIQGEINWSVSQLRTLFNSQHSPNGGGSQSSSSSSSGHQFQLHHNHPTSSRFTNGEYIDNNHKTNKANKISMERGTNRSSPYVSHHGFHTDETKVNEADSDQESYV